MVRKTVFLDLKGKIKEYASPLRNENLSKDYKIIGLQDKLNKIVSNYSDIDASGENCRLLWAELYAIFVNYFKGFNAEQKQEPRFKEITEWLNDIGNRIAFLTVRTGLDYDSYYRKEKVAQDFTYCNIEDKGQVVDKYLKLQTIIYSYQQDRKDAYEWLEELGDTDDDIIYNVAKSAIVREKTRILSRMSPKERDLIYVEDIA